VAGYWFLEPPKVWTPPASLVEFINAGPPPIYIGFGSMTDENVEGLAAIIIDALKQTNARAILAKGWAGLSPADLPTDAFLTDDVPHAWLFPKVAAVIHHGGAGTTGAAFRAGIPSIVIPFILDQFFWGRRVYELGVGPRAIPRKRLTAERLVAAIKAATTDQSMRDRARMLGEQIRQEDGIHTAVSVIAQYGIVP
jgi:UDP:flavonoid glycosyltransferase YjiC (YdhE family)